MKMIDNGVSQQVTFGKRRDGLVKEARELAVLYDADVGVLVFSGAGAGQPFDYCSPHTSWSELIQRYESITNAQLQGLNHDDDQVQQMFMEMAGLRRERDRLEASLRRQTGEELSSRSTKEELDHLDQQLESTLGKVREMKAGKTAEPATGRTTPEAEHLGGPEQLPSPHDERTASCCRGGLRDADATVRGLLPRGGGGVVDVAAAMAAAAPRRARLRPAAQPAAVVIKVQTHGRGRKLNGSRSQLNLGKTFIVARVI